MAILSELKPRNFLTDPEFENQIVEVMQININDGNEGLVDEGGYVYKTDLRKLQPIPITSELLGKLGFEKAGPQNDLWRSLKGITLYFHNGEWHISIMNYIVNRIGMKECLREWNKDRMTNDEFEEWFSKYGHSI